MMLPLNTIEMLQSGQIQEHANPTNLVSLQTITMHHHLKIPLNYCTAINEPLSQIYWESLNKKTNDFSRI